MQCSRCAISRNSLISTNNPSSLILDALSGQSLRIRFRILQYWFFFSPFLVHRFIMAGFFSRIITRRSRLLSQRQWCTHFCRYKDKVSITKRIVSVQLLSFVTSHAEYPHLYQFYLDMTDLDFSLHVLRFTVVIGDIVLV